MAAPLDTAHVHEDEGKQEKDEADFDEKDKWDIDSAGTGRKHEFLCDTKQFHVKLDKKAHTATVRYEDTMESQIGITGKQVVQKGDVKEWKLRIIRLAKNSRYYNAWVGIRRAGPYKGIWSTVLNVAQHGVVQFYGLNDKKEKVHFDCGGIILNDVSREFKNPKNLEDGDEVSLRLDLLHGVYSIRVNDGEELEIWRWPRMEDDLQYKLFFNVNNCMDDYVVQIL